MTTDLGGLSIYINVIILQLRVELVHRESLCKDKSSVSFKLRRNRNELKLSGPESFLMLAFHLEIMSGQTPNIFLLKFNMRFPQSVLIWVVMSPAGICLIHIIKSVVNRALYREILKHLMFPCAN